MNFRPLLRRGLRSHRLDGQLMVYDKTYEGIHLLDSTTATVFELLEQGADASAIKSTLAAGQAVVPASDLLALALAELSRARLIEGEETTPAPISEGRRQMIKQLAGVGAALLIPAIVTLTPSRAYAVTGVGLGADCKNHACAAGLCCAPDALPDGSGCVKDRCSNVSACC